MKKLQSQIIIYETEAGETKIDVRFDGETVWLSQKQMAELFDCSVDDATLHLKNIYAEKELEENRTSEESSVVQKEGERAVNRPIRLYNLDAIISVGYRVNSLRGTQFRIWATQKLKEYVVKGFVLDDERLKNPDLPFDYFEELLVLNNLIEQYLVFAEGQAMQRIPMRMKDWIEKLHSFLQINNKNILQDAGRVSHEMAMEMAEKNFLEYKKNEAKSLNDDFDLVAPRVLRIVKKKNKKLSDK